ncbi:unnamed protein product, partial [Anisakis simplex]|uniref:BPL/LPL catalytic domain-containing protein n=1 Tax=Anisakis simplex TaxID=6269 RepID=A0A0M3JIU2_ANISI
MYVALWYKHGVPIHGRAWNNGGVLECSFPYKKAELTGAKDLGGQIQVSALAIHQLWFHLNKVSIVRVKMKDDTFQVLQYPGDHNTLGFWYEWIKYKDRFEKTEDRQMVKCGDSLPILWKDRKEGALLGYLDNKT